MKRIGLIAILVFSGVSNVFAAPVSDSSITPSLPNDLSKLEGMYWYNFKNGFADPQEKPYQATNVLELVPYDKDSMYFRTYLSFFNGHTCGISGIAERDGTQLTYYDTTHGNGCVLHIVPTSSRITLSDPTGQCRMWSCGARGGYGDERFSPQRKKKITYMVKLKNSRQYQDAKAAYEQLKAARLKGIALEWANAKDMLMNYVSSGNLEGVKQALSQGADLEPHTLTGLGVIYGAAYSRSIEITQLLLDHGLDINKKENGATLLILAADTPPIQQISIEKQIAYINWLLEKGADPNLTSAKGEKPLDIAIRTEADQRIVDLLRDKTNINVEY